MPVNNGLITAPVSVEDVREVLGVSSRDVGYLCSNEHGKINKWSFYKPVRLPGKYNKITGEDIYRVNCGFSIPNFINAPKVLNAYNSGNQHWEYLSPRGIYTNSVSGGTLIEPYRLGDFDGYSDKTPAWYRLSLNTSTNTIELGYTVYMIMTGNWTELLKFKEFSNFTEYNLYAGCLVVASSNESTNNIGVNYYAFTGVQGLGDIDPDKLSIPANTIGVGTWKLIPVVTSVYLPQNKISYPTTTQHTGAWWSLDCDPIVIRIPDASEGGGNIQYIFLTIELNGIKYTEYSNGRMYITSFDYTIENTRQSSSPILVQLEISIVAMGWPADAYKSTNSHNVATGSTTYTERCNYTTPGVSDEVRISVAYTSDGARRIATQAV